MDKATSGTQHPPPRKVLRTTGRRSTAVAMFAGNTATVGITVAQAFVLVPLCLSALGSHLYGAWIAAAELLLWVQQLEAGVTHLLTQRVGALVAGGRGHEAEQWSATCLWLIVAIATVLVAVGMVAAPLLVEWLQVPAADADTFVAAFRLALVASGILLAGSGVTALARGVQQPAIPTAAGVVGVVVALVASVGLLLAGYGVWSLAFGLLLRAVVVAVGSMLFLWRLPRPLADWLLRPSRAVATDVRHLLPSMTAGSAGYLLANNSEIVMVTMLYGPVAGATYALTRRTIDGIRSLVENIGLAAAPGFAHLVAADDRYRARRVLRELLWLRLSGACLGAAVVVAVNEPFVTLLFGREHFGGVGLTGLFAVQMVIGGQALLLNHVLRSTGRVSESAWLRAAEAVIRVVAMGIGLAAFGLSGAPAASLVVSLAAWRVTRMLVFRVLPPESPAPGSRIAASTVLAPLAVLAIGVAVGIVGVGTSFPAMTAAAVTMATAGGAILWMFRLRAFLEPRPASEPIGRP